MKFSDNSLIIKLLPEFFESGIEDFSKTVPELIAKKDKEELYRQAHSWKGASAQYELPDLSDKCKVLLQAVNSEDWQYSLTISIDILQYLFKAKEEFDFKMNN